MLELTNGENADLQLYKQKITDEIATVTINSKKQNICCLFIPYLIFSWFMRHYSRLYRCQRDFQWGSSPPTLNYRFTKALSQVPYFFFYFTNCGLLLFLCQHPPPFNALPTTLFSVHWNSAWHTGTAPFLAPLGDRKERRKFKWKQDYVPISQSMNLWQTVSRIRWIYRKIIDRHFRCMISANILITYGLGNHNAVGGIQQANWFARLPPAIGWSQGLTAVSFGR